MLLNLSCRAHEAKKYNYLAIDMVSRNQNCYIVYTDPSLIYYYLNRNDEMMMLKIEHVTSNSLKIQVRACKFKSLFTICPSMVNALFDVDRLRTSQCEYNNYSTRLMQLSVKRSASGRENSSLSTKMHKSHHY